MSKTQQLPLIPQQQTQDFITNKKNYQYKPSSGLPRKSYKTFKTKNAKKKKKEGVRRWRERGDTEMKTSCVRMVISKTSLYTEVTCRKPYKVRFVTPCFFQSQLLVRLYPLYMTISGEKYKLIHHTCTSRTLP